MKNIKVCDLSLRSVNGNGVSLTFKEKLEIAKKLEELGVDAIELGPVAEDKTEETLIKTICTCVKNTTVSCVVGLNEKSIERSYKLISSAKSKRLTLSLPVSDVQMEYFLKKKPKAVLELLPKMLEKCTSFCDNVEVSFEDATRADIGFLKQLVAIAIKGGAKSITLSDLSGIMLPRDTEEFLNNISKDVPEIDNVDLYVSVNDCMGMALSDVFSAIYAGADGIKVSSTDKSGVNLDNFVAMINAVGLKNGYDVKINKTAIGRILKQIEQMSVGKSSKATYENVVVDNDQQIVKNFSVTALGNLIKKRGYDLSSEDVSKVCEAVKRIASKKDVSLKELDVIIATTAMQVNETYGLVNFSVQTSNNNASIASVTLVKDKKEISGLSYGNGPVDAAFLAIETVIGRHFDLDDFQMSAITEGKGAMAQTLVKLRHNGKVYSGSGVSTDIVASSIRAYISALNKIIYEVQL